LASTLLSVSIFFVNHATKHLKTHTGYVPTTRPRKLFGHMCGRYRGQAVRHWGVRPHASLTNTACPRYSPAGDSAAARLLATRCSRLLASRLYGWLSSAHTMWQATPSRGPPAFSRISLIPTTRPRKRDWCALASLIPTNLSGKRGCPMASLIRPHWPGVAQPQSILWFEQLCTDVSSDNHREFCGSTTLRIATWCCYQVKSWRLAMLGPARDHYRPHGYAYHCWMPPGSPGLLGSRTHQPASPGSLRFVQRRAVTSNRRRATSRLASPMP